MKMGYLNRKELVNDIGKFGIFYNEKSERTLKIGTLVSVTKNGSCMDRDEVYYDHFEAKNKEQLKMLIHTLQ